MLEKVLRATHTRDVVVHDVAAGEQAGTAEMIMPVRNGRELFGLAHVRHESLSDFNEGAKTAVRIAALDEYLPAAGVERVAGIKLDVENFEYFALRGSRATLARDRPPILCELWGNEHRIRTMELMDGWDYACLVLAGRELVRYDASRHARWLDFFFLPREDDRAGE